MSEGFATKKKKKQSFTIKKQFFIEINLLNPTLGAILNKFQ